MKLLIRSSQAKAQAYIFLPAKSAEGKVQGPPPKQKGWPILSREEWESPGELLALTNLGRVYKTAPINFQGENPVDACRDAFGKALKALQTHQITQVALWLPEGDLRLWKGLFEVPVLMSFDLSPYKTRGEDKKPFAISHVTFFHPNPGKVTAAAKTLSRTQIQAEGVNLARRLAYEPANLLRPQEFAKEAHVLKKWGIHVSELSSGELKKMGGLQAVGMGSTNPPRFLVMKLNPGKKKPIVLIGKGITFDAGGISIKPSDGMAEMKNDMGGGAAILGTMQTLARLGCTKSVVGLIPLAENLPDGNALKPSDVITMYDGQTVEVLNTDAEGRLILADAIAYANTMTPEFVVDIATLTGAIVVALGSNHTGYFCNDEALNIRMEKASANSRDLLWRMPLHASFTEEMKSPIADWRNIGSRKGGACLAAAFIQAFARGPWAHLDIGGTVLNETDRSYLPKSPSGVGVRLLTDLVMGDFS